MQSYYPFDFSFCLFLPEMLFDQDQELRTELFGPCEVLREPRTLFFAFEYKQQLRDQHLCHALEIVLFLSQFAAELFVQAHDLGIGGCIQHHIVLMFAMKRQEGFKRVFGQVLFFYEGFIKEQHIGFRLVGYIPERVDRPRTH